MPIVPEAYALNLSCTILLLPITSGTAGEVPGPSFRFMSGMGQRQKSVNSCAMSAVHLNAEELLERVFRNGEMNSGRCRMHGGKATGAPKGSRNTLTHGNYSAKEMAWRMPMEYLLRWS